MNQVRCTGSARAAALASNKDAAKPARSARKIVILAVPPFVFMGSEQPDQ
jgi:hypothetical protein